MRKIRVGVLFGGRSAEHDVSLSSAKNVIEAIDRTKYEVIPIGISRAGQWHRLDTEQIDSAKLQAIADSSVEDTKISLVPGNATHSLVERQQELTALDVVFPVLHGSYGEDGTIQGLLRMANIPFVGADVLGSAVGMDKDVAKRLLKEAEIPVAKFIVVHRYQSLPTYTQIVEKLSTPVFVKAVNMGSSVGITKVKNESNYIKAVDEAFKYDTKIIIEEAIVGRELECAVLGNDQPSASVVGEIIPHDEYYTYEAKYTEGRTTVAIPADISKEISEKVKALAIKTFLALECQGMARVDFFLAENDRLLVNEINTIPGFTSTSMYPKLWEASGLSYSELIERLIELALERHQHLNQLRID